MKCDEIQLALSLYDDDALAPATMSACEAHLQECPACRAELAEFRSLSRSLARLSVAPVPEDLASTISHALAIEAGALAGEPVLPWTTHLANWLQPRLIPYAFSSVASVVLFLSMFVGLRPHLVALREAQRLMKFQSLLR